MKRDFTQQNKYTYKALWTIVLLSTNCGLPGVPLPFQLYPNLETFPSTFIFQLAQSSMHTFWNIISFSSFSQTRPLSYTWFVMDGKKMITWAITKRVIFSRFLHLTFQHFFTYFEPPAFAELWKFSLNDLFSLWRTLFPIWTVNLKGLNERIFFCCFSSKRIFICDFRTKLYEKGIFFLRFEINNNDKKILPGECERIFFSRLSPLSLSLA